MKQACAQRRVIFVFTSMLLVALFPLRSAISGELEQTTLVNVVGPLSGEGFLWAPALKPTASKQISLKFNYSYHGLDYLAEGIEGSVYLLVLSGEYPVFDRLTAGLDVPFLVGYDVTSDSDWVDDSGVDFGNIRLHLRYPVVENSKYGIVVTPAFRLWLPTNTFLTVEDVPFWGEIDIVESFAAFEPMLHTAHVNGPLSFSFDLGFKFFAVEDQDDFSFCSMNFIIGVAPVASLGDLQFVLELNMLVELDEDDAPSDSDVERVVPISLAAGARHRFGDFLIELTTRIGLNEAEFYYGDFNIGLQVGYILP